MASLLRAQLVFVPDVQMRGWLNAYIPGVVDSAGYMNTVDPGIPSVITASIYVDWDTVDFTGLEYMTAVTDLTFYFDSDGVDSLVFNALPPNLESLYIDDFPGSAMPVLPGTLEALLLIGCPNLAVLPVFPPSLTFLNLSGLTSVPAGSVPSVLNGYGLSGSLLTDITGLMPDTIRGSLNLESMPQLTSLPAMPVCNSGPFPAGMNVYFTGLTSLTTIPAFPNGRFSLNTQNLYSLTSMGDLPDSMFALGIMESPLLECLPPLPDGLDALSLTDTGVDCLPNIPDNVSTTLPLCGLYNPGLCTAYFPVVTGTVYHDVNANGVRDAGEQGLEYADIGVSPGNTITGGTSDGFYFKALDPGAYTITANASNPYVTGISPAAHTAVLVNASDVDSLNDFGVTLQANVQDLAIHMTAVTPARPGFTNALNITYANDGTMVTNGSVTLTVDGDQTFVSSTPAPDVLAGSTATWNFSNLLVGYSGGINVVLSTSSGVALGEPIIHSAVVDPTITDQIQANNVDSIIAVVIGSYDPNDKVVSPTIASTLDVQEEKVVTYTIRFQNTGTYVAERVVITDTLSTDLQWSTVDLLASSHPCTWFIHDGTLRFTFDAINLPDSNSNEPASHGFVRFSLVPAPTLANGMQVGNVANIYFDFNAPVITNEALFTVSDPDGIPSMVGTSLVLSPNPVDDVLSIGLLPDERSRLTVHDATGRMIRAIMATGPSVLLDVSALPSGAYQLRLDEEGVVRHFMKY